MAYLRSSGDDALVVAINAGPQAVELSLDLPGFDGRSLVGVPLPGEDGAVGRVAVVHGRAGLALPARTGRVMRLESST